MWWCCNRNNGFSKACRRGLEGGWGAFLGPRMFQQCVVRGSVQQTLGTIQETFNSKLWHLFHVKGGKKRNQEHSSDTSHQEPCLSSARKPVLICKKLIYVTVGDVLVRRPERTPSRWRAALHAAFGWRTSHQNCPALLPHSFLLGKTHFCVLQNSVCLMMPLMKILDQWSFVGFS